MSETNPSKNMLREWQNHSFEHLVEMWIDLDFSETYVRPLLNYLLQQKLLERLNTISVRLADATENTHIEVQKLTTSSDKLETLTVKLNKLTYVLIGLAFLAVVVPVAIEFWHAYHPEKVEPIVLVLPRPSAPQTPSPPAGLPHQ
jgi:hypothetical protein